jgi:selenide,water dikinase
MSVNLLDFSKAGGCGCKMHSNQLDVVLKPLIKDVKFENISNKEDAAVFNLNDKQFLVKSTDFFLPFVTQAYDFGRIAAANAISDIYAMGASPIMALSILGWPIPKLPLEAASEVLIGAQDVCRTAGIEISGGHSIETEEPIFGLSVSGLVDKIDIKYNNTAQVGDYLQLSKPIGIGLLANALKQNVLSDDLYNLLVDTASQLNVDGIELAKHPSVTAMTDVTGFGLLGHLAEMLGNRLGADLLLRDIPLLEGAKYFADKMMFLNITTNNYNLIKDKTDGLTGLEFLYLCDPQTGGGLLFTSTEPIPNYPIIGRITNSGRISIA